MKVAFDVAGITVRVRAAVLVADPAVATRVTLWNPDSR
jgi:hypothetical protein